MIYLADFTPIEVRDNEGQTPLHYAAGRGNLEVCRFILNNIRNLNRIYRKNADGKTPLDKASEEGHTEVCQLLKLYGDLPKHPHKRPRFFNM